MRHLVLDGGSWEAHSCHDLPWHEDQCPDWDINPLAIMIALECFAFYLPRLLAKEHGSDMISGSCLVAIDRVSVRQVLQQLGAHPCHLLEESCMIW